MSRNIGVDITGQRFGHLIAIAEGPRSSGHRRWLFRCDCGAETMSFKAQVTGGLVNQCTACGHAIQAQLTTKHGRSHDPIYQIFHAAKQRCENPNDARFADYGGRGIEFRFATFQEFCDVMGARPEGFTLDRRNNDGHYEPGNVRWATPQEQADNRRPKRAPAA